MSLDLRPVPSVDVATADRVAAELLADDPARLAHVRGAARRARTLAPVLDPVRQSLLVSAAVLHDIGYAPAVRETGFHPLDGARWLARFGAADELVGLVAHHSESGLDPTAEVHRAELAGFDAGDPADADALSYADQTTTPDGAPVTLVERLAGRRARRLSRNLPHTPQDVVRAEHLAHAVARVEVRLARAGVSGPSALVPHRWLLPGPDHVTALADRVLALSPGLAAGLAGAPDAGLEPADRARAAVLAAAALRALGPRDRYADPVDVARRLLEQRRL